MALGSQSSSILIAAMESYDTFHRFAFYHGKAARLRAVLPCRVLCSWGNQRNLGLVRERLGRVLMNTTIQRRRLMSDTCTC